MVTLLSKATLNNGYYPFLGHLTQRFELSDRRLRRKGHFRIADDPDHDASLMSRYDGLAYDFSRHYVDGHVESFFGVVDQIGDVTVKFDDFKFSKMSIPPQLLF